MRVSIHKKYTFVVSIALLVTVLAFMALVRWAVVGYYEQKVRASDAQITRVLARHIERSIRSEDEVIGMLSDYPDLFESTQEEQQFVLLKTARNHPHYELLAIVDMNGMQIARSWGQCAPRGDRQWFLDFAKTKRGAISNVYTSRSTGNPIVTITKGIYDENGSAVGLIMADIRTTYLQQIIRSCNNDPDCEVYLLDNDGNAIAAPDSRDAASIDAALAGADSGRHFINDAGQECIGAYQTIDIPEINLHWRLMFVRYYDAALAPVTAIMQRTALLGFVVVLLVAFALYFMSRRMTRGFLRAGQVIRLVGQGDYSQRFEYHADDELGDIAKNLNHMIDLLVSAQRKQQAAAEKIEDMAYHDGLTGLPNRRHFMETARDVLVRAYGTNRVAALFFIDLDKFKAVNDTYGHAAGDELLIEVGRRLTHIAGRIELVCRLGGDEFLMFLPGANDLEVAQKGQHIIDVLERPIHLAGAGVDAHISASIGIARYPGDATTIDALVQLADAAMYEAKAAGRGRYVITREGEGAE